MKRYGALVVLLGLACASSGVRVREEQLAAFTPGKTTYGEVIAALGRPSMTMVSSDGKRLVMYSYAHVQVRPETLIPFVGALVGGSDVHHGSVMFRFDRDGTLVSYSSSEGEMGVGSGLAAGAAMDRTAQPRDSAPPPSSADLGPRN